MEMETRPLYVGVYSAAVASSENFDSKMGHNSIKIILMVTCPLSRFPF